MSAIELLPQSNTKTALFLFRKYHIIFNYI